MMIAAASFATFGCQRQLPPDRPANLANAEAIRQGFAKAGASSSSAGDKARQEPKGWATLRGAFKLDGTAPERAALTVNKDSEICAPAGRKVLKTEQAVRQAVNSDLEGPLEGRLEEFIGRIDEELAKAFPDLAAGEGS